MFDSVIFDPLIFDAPAAVAINLGALNPRYPTSVGYGRPWRPVAPLQRREVLSEAEIVALAFAAGLSPAGLLALLAANEEERIWVAPVSS